MDNILQRNEPGSYLAPRVRWVAVAMITVMAALGVRLWQLQLIEGESYGEMSLNNRVRLIRLSPCRGKIFDCQGRLLADNRPGFTMAVVRGDLKNPSELIETCGPVLGLAPEALRGRIERSSSVPRFLAYPVERNLTLEQVALIKTRMPDLKGVELEIRPCRVYPFGPTLCHVIGTMGQISQPELATGLEGGYRSGDVVGKTGVEKEYEPYLKGVEGWEQIEIDAKGRQLASLGVRAPEPGADVYLTGDASLQQFVEDIFIHRAGSVVVVDPDTGRILAMVSKPGYDPNIFSPPITRRQWNDVASDPLNPLENRSIRGLYAPASTFKIVAITAALAENVIKPEQTFTCKGELELAGQKFRCWNHYGHGKVNLHRATVESCDVYFYEVGLKLGPDRIARYAALLGLGKPSGLGLAQELPGLIPTPQWKARTKTDSWKDGETLNMAIGQGYMASTPIQMAMMTAAIANGGKLLKPAIVQQIRAPDGRLIFDHSPVERWQIPLDEKKLSILKAAMRGAVSERMGTGKRCRIPGIAVSGKTGTSQVIRQKQQRATPDAETPYHERAHAIFVAYVDDRPKKIAVAVVVEHGGSAGITAAPLARKIICKYYGKPDPGDTKE